MSTLFLDGWHSEEGESEKVVFPALQHLVLANISKSTTGGGLDELSCKLAENLGIKRLTFRASAGDEQGDIEAILAAIYWGTNNELREDLPDEEGWLRWPPITTIATTSYSVPWNAESVLPKLLCMLRGCGNEIRTLLLPRRFIAEAGGDTIAKMKKYVKIEEFCDDFPRPFDRGGGRSLAPARLKHTDCQYRRVVHINTRGTNWRFCAMATVCAALDVVGDGGLKGSGLRVTTAEARKGMCNNCQIELKSATTPRLL